MYFRRILFVQGRTTSKLIIFVQGRTTSKESCFWRIVFSMVFHVFSLFIEGLVLLNSKPESVKLRERERRQRQQTEQDGWIKGMGG